MAGLNLNLGAGAQVASATAQPPAPTATVAGFGPAFDNGGASSTNPLFPNDPFGVALWVGVGSLAVLLFIRYSLPA